MAACVQSAAMQGLTSGERVLSTATWERPEKVVDGLLAVLSVGGSLVQVANPDPAAVQRRIEMEKVTRVL
jgi:non-ribosomal peptide synthetase component E (peptide arylation enzyme)